MSHGFFHIYIKQNDERPWTLFESMAYDDGTRYKRRKRIFRQAKQRVFGFRENYWQFRDSSFSIEEQVDVYSMPVHVSGIKRPKPKVKGHLKRKVPSWMQQPPEEIVYKIKGTLVRKVPKNKILVEIKEVVKGKEGKVKKLSAKSLAAAKRHYRQQTKKWKVQKHA